MLQRALNSQSGGLDGMLFFVDRGRACRVVKIGFLGSTKVDTKAGLDTILRYFLRDSSCTGEL